jgi:hypothetical protein
MLGDLVLMGDRARQPMHESGAVTGGATVLRTTVLEEAKSTARPRNGAFGDGRVNRRCSSVNDVPTSNFFGSEKNEFVTFLLTGYPVNITIIKKMCIYFAEYFHVRNQFIHYRRFRMSRSTRKSEFNRRTQLDSPVCRTRTPYDPGTLRSVVRNFRIYFGLMVSCAACVQLGGCYIVPGRHHF